MKQHLTFQVTEQTEAKARAFLREKILRRIANFSTSYEDDAANLVSGKAIPYDE